MKRPKSKLPPPPPSRPGPHRRNVLRLAGGAYVQIGRGSDNGLLIGMCNGPENYALVRLARAELVELIARLRAEARRM